MASPMFLRARSSVILICMCVHEMQSCETFCLSLLPAGGASASQQRWQPPEQKGCPPRGQHPGGRQTFTFWCVDKNVPWQMLRILIWHSTWHPRTPPQEYGSLSHSWWQRTFAFWSLFNLTISSEYSHDSQIMVDLLLAMSCPLPPISSEQPISGHTISSSGLPHSPTR